MSFNNLRLDSEDELDPSCNEKIENNPLQQEPTLLDKAMGYRQNNSEKWKKRVKDRETAVLESFGIYQEDTFLDSYYERIDEIVKEKKIYQEERKQKSPQIAVQIQFSAIRKNAFLSESSIDLYKSSIRRASTVPAAVSELEANAELDIFEISPPNSRRTSTTEVKTEMQITITKAKYLLNWLGKDQRKYKSCQIKCMLYPKSKQTGNTCKLKTRPTYINMKGTARYHHLFKLHGFSAQELANKHVMLEVTGKNNERKEVIGRLVLAGKNAQIYDSNSNGRRPTSIECESWQDALENPGVPVNAKLDLHPVKEDTSSERGSVTFPRSTQPRPSEKRRWSFHFATKRLLK